MGNPGERESCRRRWGLPSHCPSKTSTGHSKPKGSGSPRSDLPPIRCSLGHRQKPAIANVAGASSSLYIGFLHPRPRMRQLAFVTEISIMGSVWSADTNGHNLSSWPSALRSLKGGVNQPPARPHTRRTGGRTLAFPRPLGDRRTVHTRPRSHSLRTCELNLAAGKPDPRLHKPPAAGH